MKNSRFYSKATQVGAMLFTFFLALFGAKNVGAQAGFPLKCGSISNSAPNGSNPDSLVYDRFGNVFDIEDLLVPPPTGELVGGGCQSGFFSLTFDTDFPMNMRPTVCQVFADLSAIMVEHSNTLVCGDALPSQQVAINIIWESLTPSNVLGIGSPFYSAPNDGACNEMVLDRPFIKINGGIANPAQIFDGRMYINSNPSDGLGNIPWHENWLTPVGQNEVDLYSVVLHEALHILGFASRIGSPEYTLWDRILHITDHFVPNGGSPNTQPILTNSPPELPCTSNLHNCWAFNEPEVTVNDLSIKINNTCDGNNANPDIVIGETAIAAIDWANGGTDPGALSHLSETCNGSPLEEYVMVGGFARGSDKRIISQDELQILCEIGYEITTNNFSCSGCYNIANMDRPYQEGAACCFKTYYACAGTTFEVLNEEILCNDVTNGGLQVVTRLWQSAVTNPLVSIQPNALSTGWLITIPSNINASILTLMYTVSGCDCRMHNGELTIAVDRQCPDCTFTPDPCDNLLCAADFENFTHKGKFSAHFGWPIVFEGANWAGSPDVIGTIAGNHYLHLGDFSPNREAVTLELKKCIEPGCELTMSMDLARGINGNEEIEVWGSEDRPCNATIMGANPIAHTCGTPTICNSNSTFEPVCLFDNNEFLATGQWIDNDNVTFVTAGPFTRINQTDQKICFLTLVPVGFMVYVDNIIAEISCEPEITCEEPISDEVCQGEIADITFQICAPDMPESLDLTLVTPSITLPLDWTLIGGTPSTFTLMKGQCQTITLQVQIPANSPIGSTEMILLSGTATGYCTLVEWSCSAKVTVIECVQQQVFTCPCTGEGQLNIDASTNSPFYSNQLGGTPYSALEAFFNYDEDNDGRIESKDHNNCIAVLGNLIIDQNVDILSCDSIKMQPCSEITVGTVASHSIMGLTKNTIFSCETMWHGITVKPHATLNFTGNEIRNAQFAITAISGNVQAGVPPTKMISKDNMYLDNHIGVFFPGTASKTVSHFPFTGNTFKCTADLLPPCDADLPNYNTTLRGYAGVVTLGTPLTVGTAGASGYDNTFGGIRNGVIGERCYLVVNRADIQDIIGGPDVYPPSFAGAIGNGVVAIDGKAAVVNSKFAHVPRGVFGQANKTLTVSNNKMTFMIRGVETLSVGHSVISNNPTIGFADRGILCREVIPASGLGVVAHQIDNNTDMFITPNPNGPQYLSAAIEIDNAMSVDVGVASISNNHFSNGGFFAHGIRINGSGGWDIANNIIDFQAPSILSAYFNVGIQLTNTHENYLYQNTVNDFALQSNESTALSLADGTGNRYCCNITHGSRNGSRFLGACGSTEWRVTDMLNHEFALFCDPGTVISPQFDYGNDFNATSGMAFHGGQDQDVINSRFRVLNMQQPHWPEAISTPNTTENFFIQPGIDAYCIAPCTAPMYTPPPPDRDIDESDLTTVYGGYTGGTYGTALQWENERRLYERMSDYEGMIGANAATDAFHNAATNSKIGAYYQAENAAKCIYNYPSSIDNGLQTSAAQLESIRLAVEVIHSQLAQAQTTADSALIYQNANMLYVSGQSASEALQDYQAQAQGISNTQAFNAYMVTNTLPADNLLEQNRKAVQRLYLQTLGLGISQLNLQQLAEAESIAIQCPLVGGSAVYAARALYRLNFDKVFMDDSLCTPTQERRVIDSRPTSMNEIRLVPNPATETVTISSLTATAEQRIGVSILNTSGIVCAEFMAEEHELTFSVSSLPSGIYFCKVQSAKGSPKTLKLIVSH